LGASPVSADALLGGSGRGDEGARERAAAFMEQFLAGGPRTSHDIWQAAQKAGLSARTVQRAKPGVGIRCRRVQVEGRFVSYWLLPGQHLPAELAGDDDLSPWLDKLERQFPPRTPLDEEELEVGDEGIEGRRYPWHQITCSGMMRKLSREGGHAVNKEELRQLAQERILDAKALLAARRWGGAYHLAGYAVECALKACILGLVERTGIIFEDRKYAERCWTHDLEELVQLAELREPLAVDLGTNAALQENWDIVKVWDEASRYRKTSHHEAKRLYQAITDKVNGIMPWITSRW
jgi:hypothetical protein